MRNMRVFILLGQGGWTTSGGMLRLADRIKMMGNTIVTTHSWDETQRIANDLITTPDRLGKVLIGFSLGAGSAAYIASLPHTGEIDLLVGYDPSRYQPFPAIKKNTKRAICYYNGHSWFYGGAKYTGVNVEIVPITNFHLAVCWDDDLHTQTVEAIKKAQKG